MPTDQFSPGFAGLFCGLLAVVILAIVVIALRTGLMRLVIQLSYRVRRWDQQVEADWHTERERGRAEHGNETDSNE